MTPAPRLDSTLTPEDPAGDSPEGLVSLADAL